MWFTENINGDVYICNTQSDYFKPEIVTTKYKTTGASVIPSGLRVNNQGCNSYQVKFNDVWMAVNPIEGLGNLIVEIVPFPKPKGKYKYHNGEWVK